MEHLHDAFGEKLGCSVDRAGCALMAAAILLLSFATLVIRFASVKYSGRTDRDEQPSKLHAS